MGLFTKKKREKKCIIRWQNAKDWHESKTETLISRKRAERLIDEFETAFPHRKYWIEEVAG